MKYFTSDWHLWDERQLDSPNPLLRNVPFLGHYEDRIIKSCSILEESDELYFIGDLTTTDEEDLLNIMNEIPVCYKALIIGNYDEPRIDIVSQFFVDVCEDMELILGDNRVYLNHYPEKCQKYMKENTGVDFSITGHIHSLWKVARKMINVSVDAWDARIISEKEILYVWNAINNHYDHNVFLK